MLNDKGHIDKLFSEGLKDLSVKPRPDLWADIQADIKTGRRKKRLAVMYITLAAVASIALLFTFSDGYLFQQDVRFEDVEQFSNVDSVLNTEKLPAINDAIVKEQLANVVIQTEKDVRTKQRNQIPVGSVNSENKRNQRKIVMQMVLPKAKANIISNSQLPMQISQKVTDTKDATNSVFYKDSLIIARNLKMIEQFNKEDRKKKEWSILGQVSSAYSSYSGDKSGDNSESGLISVGGGVKVNWQTNKKLSIQTGVIYNKFGQELGNGNMQFESATFSSDVVTRVGSSPDVKTSAGKIKMRERNIQGSEMMASRANALSSSSDVIQSFEALEIPFILKYNLVDKKFGLHLSGGFSTNLMIGNRVYDKSSKETLGETTGIRTTNFSTSFSLGLEYQLSSKFSLSMEPSLKYYLNSINKDASFNYKPYSIGINSGIRYKF